MLFGTKRTWTTLGLLLLVGGACLSSRAEARACHWWLKRLLRPGNFFAINPSPELRERLRTATRRIRADWARTVKERGEPGIGDTIEHNGKPYVITQVLGAGPGHGTVYVVTDEGGRVFGLKKFNAPFLKPLGRLSGLAYRTGLRARAFREGCQPLKTYGFDPRSQTLLTEYVDGIPLDYVNWYGSEHGLADGDWARVQAFLDENNISYVNHVIDCNSGKIYLIDEW